MATYDAITAVLECLDNLSLPERAAIMWAPDDAPAAFKNWDLVCQDDLDAFVLAPTHACFRLIDNAWQTTEHVDLPNGLTLTAYYHG